MSGCRGRALDPTNRHVRQSPAFCEALNQSGNVLVLEGPYHLFHEPFPQMLWAVELLSAGNHVAIPTLTSIDADGCLGHDAGWRVQPYHSPQGADSALSGAHSGGVGMAAPRRHPLRHTLQSIRWVSSCHSLGW